MNKLQIDIGAEPQFFKPGQKIAGRVTWQVDQAPTSAELRLFWYTSGKGTQDVGTIEAVPFPAPQLNDDRTFSLTLPREPYSFSGQLISVVWALELLVEPGSNVQRQDFFVSASGAEVLLS